MICDAVVIPAMGTTASQPMRPWWRDGRWRDWPGGPSTPAALVSVTVRDRHAVTP